MVFFDDILVYNSSYEARISHLKQVLQLLLKDEWKVKMSKY